MLRAQGSINRDLAAEVEDLQNKLREDRTALQAKADDWEHLADQRLQQVRTLKAQLTTLRKQGVAASGTFSNLVSRARLIA